MTQPHHTTRTTAPRLDDLLGRFMASTAGSDVRAEDGPEVELHEIHGGFQADATLLWDEARRVFGLLNADGGRLPAPPEWQSFTRVAGTSATIPLAAGFFPQRLQDVQTVLGRTSAEPTAGAKPSEPDVVFAKLRAWAEKTVRGESPPAALVASGVLASLGDTATAVTSLEAREPASQDGSEYVLWANQLAAVLWTAGRTDDAVALWQRLPQSGVTRYNLGMAKFAAGSREEAVEALNEAGDLLPDASGWTHLARLLAALSR